MAELWRVTTLLTGSSVVGGGINHLYFAEGVGTSEDAGAAVVEFWDTVMDTTGGGVVYNVQEEIAVIDIATGQQTGVAEGTPGSGSGQISGDVLPPATQGLVRWRTGAFLNGRELRGRTFLPGPPESYNSSEGGVAGTYLENVGNAITGLITAAGLDFNVYSKTHQNRASVSTGSCWTKWAILRSRRD